ncbi:MAG TPA: DUF4760 domain-containing protein [Actinomycetota bacterium]|jgi:hypothetical protein|nr:DUF4760 domain-containing protein [Actinomycetota bacterium]
MATPGDAALMVQLLRWGTELKLEEAVNAIYADDFDPDEVPAANPAVTSILFFSEGVGTLVKHGLLDRDLVLDMWAVASVWKRLESAIRRERERTGEPRLYENFEALASPDL